jgi:hypothetical protein
MELLAIESSWIDNYGLHLPPGDYVVRLAAPGREPVERRVTVVAGEVARVDFGAD